MLGRVKTSFNRSILRGDIKFSRSRYCKADTLLDLVKFGERNRDYVVFKSKFGRYEVCYMHDIRFDYLHGRVFFPIFVYKYHEVDDLDRPSFKRSKLYEKTDAFEIMYNQEIEQFEIWNSKEGYTVDELIVLRHNFFGTKFFKVPISHLSLRNDIKEESAEILIDKYVKSYYYNNEYWDTLYYSPKKSYLSKAERSLLKKYRLKWYSNDETEYSINYRDVRTYKTIDLYKTFPEEEMILEDSFFIRVIDFESYLLCHLSDHVYWSDCQLKNLRSGKWYFEKYKTKGVALIFKDYWLAPYK